MQSLRLPRIVLLSILLLIVLLATAPSVSANRITTHPDANSGSSTVTSQKTQGDWTQYRYNTRHTGTNPFEKILSPANVHRLKVAWSVPTSVDFSSPSVANGVVYVGAEDMRLHAFNAQTGTQLWSAPTGGRIFSSPAIANGIVYIGSDNGSLHAFNAQMGTQLWSDILGNSVQASPTVVKGVVYIGSDTHMYAFEHSDRTTLWSVKVNGGADSRCCN